MKNWHFYFNKTCKKAMLCGVGVILCVITMLLGCHFYMNAILPEKIYITANEEQTISLPIPGVFSCESSEVLIQKTSSKESDSKVEMRNDNAISDIEKVEITKNDKNKILDETVMVSSSEIEKGAYTLYSNTTGQYELSFKLFGIWDYKSVLLEVMEEREVIPGGMPVGIYLESDGILVIGTATLHNESGEEVSPCKDLLQAGDYIVAVNGEKIKKKEQLIELVEMSKGEVTKLNVRRGEKILVVEVTPFLDESGMYKLGVWVRDDTQGIGTITYITSDGSFGALGHGISDADIGVIMECDNGTLYEAQIRGIIKGVSGTPGSLSGVICYGSSSVMGEITSNTEQGIFGIVNDRFVEQLQLEPMEIAYKQEVKVGPATIFSTIDGEIKEYDILIKEVKAYSSNSNKGMVIEIVDEELLEKTGGIVQGMSGSPVIQNGRIVGAVTHVLVNDPTRGYGIFIENMLEAAQ